MKQALVAGLPTTGHYVVVMTGDLRSAVLLHQLTSQPGQQLRLRLACPDSASPRARTLVRDIAAAHDLPYHQTATHQLSELAKSQKARGVITTNQNLKLDDVKVIYALVELSDEGAQAYAKLHGLVWLRGEKSQPQLTDPINLRRRGLEERRRQLDQDLDRRLAKSFYQFRSVDGIRLPRSWVAEANWDQLLAIIDYSLRKLAPQASVAPSQIHQLVTVAKTAPTGHHQTLPGSLKLQIEYDTVAIVLAGSAAVLLPVMTLVPQTSVNYGQFRLSFGDRPASADLAIQLAGEQYLVRSYRPGDRITTAAGTRKLQDVFTDNKIDRQRRSTWPLICDDAADIIWVPGLATAKQVLPETPNRYTLIAEEV